MSTQANHSAALSHLFSQLEHVELLTAEQERELAGRIARGDDAALQELVLANVRMVVRTAKPYRSAGMPFEDLVGEGVLGLIEAARRFDPDQGNRFITCAIWWVRKAIFAALRTQVRLVRIPSFQLRKEREIRAGTEALERELGRSPSREEISASMDQSGKEVDRVLARSTSEFSIDQPSNDETPLNFAGRIESGEGGDQETEFIREQNVGLVVRAVTELPAIERSVIELRFGLGGSRPQVLREVGRSMGLSRERVRQIECQATDRLKKIMNRLERPFVARTRVPPPDLALSQAAQRPESLSAAG